MSEATEKRWVEAECLRNNLPEPVATLAKNGNSWGVSSRGRKIGRLTRLQAADQRSELVASMCELPMVIRIELAKPLPVDATWDEAMRDAWICRDLIHEVMNEALFSAATKVRAGEKANHYQEAKAALTLVQNGLAERAQKSKKHREWLTDRAEFSMSGALLAELGQMNATALDKWKKNSRTEAFPTRKRDQPIPLRAADAWKLEAHSDGLDLSLKLSGGSGGWHKFAAKVQGASHHAVVRAYLDGDASRKSAKLIWDPRRKRWIVQAVFGVRRKPPAEGKGVATLRVGMRDFVYLLGSDGWVTAPAVTESVVATKIGFAHRKAALMQSIKNPGGGKNGHGKRRKYRAYSALDDKERRWVDTWCKQLAAKVAATCAERGYVRVLLQELTKSLPGDLTSAIERQNPHLGKLLRRFPMFQLQNAIAWALTKRGIAVEVVSDAYNAQRCPECGTVDAASHHPKTQGFRCVSCGLDLPSDYVAGWNTLDANEVDCPDVARRGRARSASSKRLREQAETLPEAAE